MLSCNWPVKIIVLVLIAISLAGCRGAEHQVHPIPATTINSTIQPEASPTLTDTETLPPIATAIQLPTTSPTSDPYGFPTQIDPGRRYLFYLHGRIIEDQGLPAVSPEFGEYQYEQILEVLEGYGFVVISEQRPKNADGWDYARKGARQIAELMEAGVPPGNITVVGASKGAAIAAGISNLAGNQKVNYVLLGTCHPDLIDAWRQEGFTLSGNVLSIYDIADDEYSGSCQDLFARSEGHGLEEHSEIVLQVGTGHGILYQSLDEWIVPTIRWAKGDGVQ